MTDAADDAGDWIDFAEARRVFLQTLWPDRQWNRDQLRHVDRALHNAPRDGRIASRGFNPSLNELVALAPADWQKRRFIQAPGRAPGTLWLQDRDSAAIGRRVPGDGFENLEFLRADVQREADRLKSVVAEDDDGDAAESHASRSEPTKTLDQGVAVQENNALTAADIDQHGPTAISDQAACAAVDHESLVDFIKQHYASADNRTNREDCYKAARQHFKARVLWKVFLAAYQDAGVKGDAGRPPDR